ncbi:MAG: bifunctional nuclease family protein [bacterium]|nr:bifunctional nuclease family protein [bacterium]
MRSELHQMKVDKLGIDLITHDPVIILKDEANEHILPIAIGVFEATAIALVLEHSLVPMRPIAHDLIKGIFEALDGSLQKIVINKFDNGVFFAEMVIESSSGNIFKLDARPSDCIAVALRMNVPIFATSEVIESEELKELQVIMPEEDIKEEFEDLPSEDELDEDTEDTDESEDIDIKSFIDNLKPSDFSSDDEKDEEAPNDDEG